MVMFVKTSSMDDIVDMAHMLILDAIGARLLPRPRTRSRDRGLRQHAKASRLGFEGTIA
jgi:hypothetical protein